MKCYPAILATSVALFGLFRSAGGRTCLVFSSFGMMNGEKYGRIAHGTTTFSLQYAAELYPEDDEIV